MNLLKYALIGSAVVYGIQYVTKKRADGTSIMDDIMNKAPEWVNKGKQYAMETVKEVKNTVNDVGDHLSNETRNNL